MRAWDMPVLCHIQYVHTVPYCKINHNHGPRHACLPALMRMRKDSCTPLNASCDHVDRACCCLAAAAAAAPAAPPPRPPPCPCRRPSREEGDPHQVDAVDPEHAMARWDQTIRDQVHRRPELPSCRQERWPQLLLHFLFALLHLLAVGESDETLGID